MSHESLGAPLLHILDFSWLTHVLFIRDDFHDVGESRFVTVWVLFAHIVFSLRLLFNALSDAGHISHRLVPLFFLPRDEVDFLQFLSCSRFQLF